MKKIITFVFVVLTAVCFVGCGEKDDAPTVSYLTATQRINSGEDCWISADGKEFYIAEGRNENGMPTTVRGYRIVN